VKVRSVLVVMCLVVSLSAAGAGDVWQQLGMSKSEASKDAVFSIATGQVGLSQVRSVLKSASPATRAAIVEQVILWAKAYVSSPQFAKDYAAYREEQKPQGPDVEQTVDQVLAERRQQRRDDLAEAKKNLAETPAEYRKDAEAIVRDAEKQLADVEKNPEFARLEREGIEAERRDAQQRYAEDLQQWKDSYPADPNQLVRQRLAEFLEASANVDYDAKLVSRHGRMRFANEEYESASSEWKLCYRAGREATTKARELAQAWLNELGR
jgi:hypothetical protein